MRILFYTGSLNSGGAERQLVYTASGLAREGHQVKILINYPIYHYKNLLDENIEVICSNSSKYTLYKRYYYLIKEILKFKPDVVHSFLGNRNLEAMFISKIFGVRKRVASVRNASKAEYRYYKKFEKYSTDVICNSQRAKNEIEEMYGKNEKLKVIYNGIDITKYKIEKNIDYLKKELKITEENRIGVFIGRISEQKNHEECIKAYIELFQNNYLSSGDKLYLIGNILEQNIYENIINLINKNKMDNNIIYLGERKDIINLLSISDYLILPSKYEGLPNVVMEAMLTNTFVLATNVGGTAELVENQETGLLIEKTTKESIVENIEKYINLEKEKKEKIIKNAKEKIEGFTIKKLVIETLKVYFK